VTVLFFELCHGFRNFAVIRIEKRFARRALHKVIARCRLFVGFGDFSVVMIEVAFPVYITGAVAASFAYIFHV